MQKSGGRRSAGRQVEIGGTAIFIRSISGGEGLEEKELVTRDILRIFQMDIMQMVYSWLEKQEIKAHILFAGKESEEA